VLDSPRGLAVPGRAGHDERGRRQLGVAKSFEKVFDVLVPAEVAEMQEDELVGLQAELASGLLR
jgi:hypothetical protein